MFIKTLLAKTPYIPAGCTDNTTDLLRKTQQMIDLFRKTCNELKENLPAIAVSSMVGGFLMTRVFAKIAEQPIEYTVMAGKTARVQLTITGIAEARMIEPLPSPLSMADLRAEG